MSNRTSIVILVQVLGTRIVDVTLYLAAEERMTPSGSESPRVYAELTGVGPITTVQTPISHHPFVPMYPQCESYSVCSSIPSCIHHQSITMLFQSTLFGNNLWVLSLWGWYDGYLRNTVREELASASRSILCVLSVSAGFASVCVLVA